MSALPPLVCDTVMMSPLNLEVSFDRRELICEINEWVIEKLKHSSRKVEKLFVNVIGKIKKSDGREEEYHQNTEFTIKDDKFRISTTGPFLASLSKLISESNGYHLHFSGDLYTSDTDLLESRLWVESSVLDIS